jgi:hypothetical protein
MEIAGMNCPEDRDKCSSLLGWVYLKLYLNLICCVDWAPEALMQIQRRNDCETLPFEGLIASTSKLFYQVSSMQRHQLEIRKEVAKMKNEISVYLITEAAKSSSSTTTPKLSSFATKFLERLKQTMTEVHFETREVAFIEKQERNNRMDISKCVREFSKRIQDQGAEIEVAKVIISFSYCWHGIISFCGIRANYPPAEKPS